jgi:hypothetical protein
MENRRSWRTRVRHDHSVMTGESGAVTGICERALPLPVKVRPPRWPPRPGPASPTSRRAGSASRGMGAWLGSVDGHRQDCVGGQFHPRSGSTAPRLTLTGHGRRFPTGFGPQGGHHLAGCAIRFARRRHDADRLLSCSKRTPRFAVDLLKENGTAWAGNRRTRRHSVSH